MQPARKHSLLRIVPKSSSRQLVSTQPLRQIAPQRGIIWKMIVPVFERNGWQIETHSELFIKATHPQTAQMIIISNLGHGKVFVNLNYQTHQASELHELENLAERPSFIQPIHKID